MNYEKRFLEITDFLTQHTYLHELEMLERFESPLISPYKEWSNELSTLSADELLKIENNYETSSVQSEDLKDFIKACQELSELPKVEINESKIETNLKRKLSLKKQHEIGMICSLINNEKIENKINKFIDIGSGAGHLSSCLVNSERTSICIDLNQEFQKAGEEKLKRWAPKIKDQIKFVKKEIHSYEDLKEFSPSDSMVIGLHSCGPLSTHIVKSTKGRLLNFGCCYHKLKDEYNISSVASKNPIIFTKHALTSAAKGYAYLTHEDFQNKLLTKRYRYALHFFLKEKLGLDFQTIGNAKKEDYKGAFSLYAQKYSKEASEFSKEELESYYQDKKSFVDQIISSGTLRSLLGRLIEIYIILDRAIYLKENSTTPLVFELFNRKYSPRNIAIYI